MPRARTAASTARLVATSAGCCTSVCTSSSIGAPKQSRRRSSPDARLAMSNTSIASGTASAISRPIPCSSEPWPGKQKAILPLVMPPSPPSIRSTRTPTSDLHPRCELEDLASIHAHIVLSARDGLLGRRRARASGWDVELGAARSVRAELEADEAAGLDALEDNRTCSVTEDDAGRAVGP